MPASYKIDKERRLALSSAYRVFCRAMLWGICKSFSRIRILTPLTRRSRISRKSPKWSFPPKIFTNRRRGPFSRRNCAALSFVPNDAAYGLGRMFGMLRENQGEMGIRVFRTLDEASTSV